MPWLFEERPHLGCLDLRVVNPVVAVALGTVFLNEKDQLCPRSPAGAAIVVAVVLIVTARTPKKQEVVELSRAAQSGLRSRYLGLHEESPICDRSGSRSGEEYRDEIELRAGAVSSSEA